MGLSQSNNDYHERDNGSFKQQKAPLKATKRGFFVEAAMSGSTQENGMPPKQYEYWLLENNVT